MEFTNRCFLECRFCNRYTTIQEDMALPLLKEIVSQAAHLEILDLTGAGEPLYHQRFEDALSLIREIRPGLRISFTTNGYLLKNKIDFLVSKGNISII